MHSDIASSLSQQVVSPGWHFDALSFVLGLGIALLVVGWVYRYRGRIIAFRERIQAQIQALRRRLTSSMATRYSTHAVEAAQRMHGLGELAPLDQIYVERRLYPPLAPPDTEVDQADLSPLQAAQTGSRLAIIGEMGSGRTVILSQLLLHYATQLQATDEKRRVPVYVHLPVLAAGMAGPPTETGTEPEPEPVVQLIDTAVASFSRVVASGVARWLQRQVEAGNALILLDAWDEVALSDRSKVTAWIKELAAAQPDNRIIVTAGERGYAPLLEAGLVPLRPVPWKHSQFAELARRWRQVLPPGEQKVSAPELPEQEPGVSRLLHWPTPLEATIELVIQLHGQPPARVPADRMGQLLHLLLPAPPTDNKGQSAWPLKTGHKALEHLAFTLQEQGRSILSREEIQATVTEVMPSPRFALNGATDTAFQEQSRSAREEEETRTLQIVDCCRALTAPGAPIRTWDNQHYFFIHPLLTAYLAARHLAEADGEGQALIIAHAGEWRWQPVLHFYAGLAPVAPVVQHLLGAADDLFLSRLWTAAGLIKTAPAGQAPWRQNLIKRLAQLLMNGRVPDYLRQRAMAALMESGVTEVGLLFKKVIDHPDPLLRAGATLALGVLGREQDLAELEASLYDEDLQVRLAAVDALSRLSQMGNEAAFELIVTAMIEADDPVQRAAAEALACLGPEGEAVLRDGARDSDLVIRRATVYGLAAVGTPWSDELLQELEQDKEWLVRNAAINILGEKVMGDKEISLPELTLPQVETAPWLIAWAAQRGEGTGVGDAALATLTRALVEGEPPIRQAAIETLERLADPRSVALLRQLLRDPEPGVRQAALVALSEISRRHDMVIAAQ